MENAIQFIFYLVILLFSVVIHEISHGYAALALGDTTAKDAGRLTLNPIPHIDPFGSIILPLLLAIPAFFGQPTILLGWARPVPYNPYRLRNARWGSALVGAAGPISNILLAMIFGLLVRFLPSVIGAVSGAFVINFLSIASTIVLVNLILALFNLVPIPPLDGSKVLFAALPFGWQWIQMTLERYGFFLLLFFIFFFSQWLVPVVLFLFRFITGSLPLIF